MTPRRLRLCRAVSHVVSLRHDEDRLGVMRALWLSLAQPSVSDPLFIICEPRTGSTLLGDYLNSHPMVECKFEILNQGLVPLLGCIRSKGDAKFYLSTLFKSIGNEVRCGKIHFSHFDAVGLTVDDLLKWFDQARFIILYRESILAQFVSLKLAEATDRWIETRTAPEIDLKLHVEVDELSAFARDTKRRYSDLVRHPGLSGRYLAISYEELTEASQETFEAKIWPFLGIASHRVHTMLRKQNLRALGDCIANFHDIEPLWGSGALDHRLDDNS